MKYTFIILLLLFSCNQADTKNGVETSVADSAIKKSMKLNDSSFMALQMADKTTEVIVKEAIKKVDKLEKTNLSLKSEVNSLKESSKLTKTITIRDTIYITEKKNFWGKTKKTIDSSQSEVVIEDSTQNKL